MSAAATGVTGGGINRVAYSFSDSMPGEYPRASGRRFGPQRVKMTLAADSTPSTTMEAAASAK